MKTFYVTGKAKNLAELKAGLSSKDISLSLEELRHRS
jgi:hypothetical protein